MIAASNQPCDSLTPDWPKPLSHGPHSKFPHCPSLPAMLAPPPRRPLQGPPAPNWLLINDFSLSPCPPSEVRNVYAGQKLPCLVYYTRVSTTGGDGRGGGEGEQRQSMGAAWTMCTGKKLPRLIVYYTRVSLEGGEERGRAKGGDFRQGNRGRGDCDKY